MQGSSFTLRLRDRVGVRVATRSVGTVLAAAGAPRGVVDDVRLATEFVLDAGVDHVVVGGGECVMAVACQPGRIGLEMRVPALVEIDERVLGALVDEVDVTPTTGATTVGLDRSWYVG